MSQSPEMHWVRLYRDETNEDAWKAICHETGMPREAESVTIRFDANLAECEMPKEE